MTTRRLPRGRPGSRREGCSRRVQSYLGITLAGRMDLSSSSLRHGHYGGVRIHRGPRSGSPPGGAAPRGLKRRRMKQKKLIPKKKKKGNQVLAKETEKEAERKRRKTIRRRKGRTERKPTCEIVSSASRGSLLRSWRRETRLDRDESWEGKDEKKNRQERNQDQEDRRGNSLRIKRKRDEGRSVTWVISTSGVEV